jgi:hypothetical protein
VATVFACVEYESWLLAAAERLVGLPLPDRQPGIRADAVVPSNDQEKSPRNPKAWVNQHLDAGYKPVRDQELLTKLVDHIDCVRARSLRSFRRLENAVQGLLQAVRAGSPVVTPDIPSET